MTEENVIAQPGAIEEEIGEEYIEEVQEGEIEEEAPKEEEKEGEKEGESENGEKVETASEKKARTNEERIEIAQEFYGVKKEDVVIDKNGNLRLIMKINGKNRLVDPQKDILKGFNLNQAGYEKLNEGKQLIKQVQGFMEDVKQNPSKLWEMAENLGIDKYAIAQSLLQEKVDEYELTPEQKREKELEKREAELAKKEEDEKKRNETIQEQQARQVEMERYDKELTAAMIENGFQKSSKGTKSHILTAAIGELMVANQLGRELSCSDAVSRAKDKWQEQVIGILDDIDVNHFEKIMPEKLVKAIRKADLKRIDNRIPTSNVQFDEVDQKVDLEDVETKPRKRKKVSMSDYFSSLK